MQGTAGTADRGTERSGERWLRRAGAAFFALCLAVLLIAGAVRFAATSGWWWERGFDRFDAAARTGLDRAEVNRGAAALRAYFASDDEFPAITVTNRAGEPEALFSERETLHLRDVKRLLDRTYDAGWAALGFVVALLAVGLARWRRAAAGRLGPALVWAGAGVAVAIVALGVVAVSGFDEAFRRFHLLFFTNDLWQLSSRDRLIQLFPQGFFFESALLIGGVALGGAALTALVGWLLQRSRSAAAVRRALRGPAL